jgi:NhaP-type Na+/H+ or K+/H+ antiporter
MKSIIKKSIGWLLVYLMSASFFSIFYDGIIVFLMPIIVVLGLFIGWLSVYLITNESDKGVGGD